MNQSDWLKLFRAAEFTNSPISGRIEALRPGGLAGRSGPLRTGGLADSGALTRRELNMF